MQLEDHPGDILRKARAMQGLTAAAVAAAVGMPEASLTAFETEGQSPTALDLAALARSVGLHPEKFTTLANGWRPGAVALNRWQRLVQFTTAGGDLTVNCYLAWDPATRAAALFDTGLEARPILDCLAENQLQLQHLFITHSHWDHIEALPALRAAFPAAQLHNSSPHAPAAQRNQPGAIVALGGLRIAHRETPGHAEDGATYLITGWPGQAPAVAVVGDTIFAGSMGRGNQSWELAREKIREHILSLPPETLLCPGHGPLTTAAEESDHNPFF
jgi:hydroxyacylglutathione hydrolase